MWASSHETRGREALILLRYNERVRAAAPVLRDAFGASLALFVAVAVAVAVACVAVGCTFAVSFDDQPSCDGGLCSDADRVTPDVTVAIDGGHDGSLSRDASTDAPKDVFDESYQPCKGLSSGLYCAGDHIVGYRGPASDLVTCDGGAIARVLPCGDAGCIAMKDPFPDTCNACPTKQNGNYCGRDFPSFPVDNADILIGCQFGNVSLNYPCPRGCHSAGTDAGCN